MITIFTFPLSVPFRPTVSKLIVSPAIWKSARVTVVRCCEVMTRVFKSRVESGMSIRRSVRIFRGEGRHFQAAELDVIGVDPLGRAGFEACAHMSLEIEIREDQPFRFLADRQRDLASGGRLRPSAFVGSDCWLRRRCRATQNPHCTKKPVVPNFRERPLRNGSMNSF